MLLSGGGRTSFVLPSLSKLVPYSAPRSFFVRGAGLPIFGPVDSGGDDPGGAILGGVVRLDGVPCVLVCPCPQLRPNTSARLECARPLWLCPSGVLL